VGSEGQDGRILYQRLTTEGWSVLGIGRDSVRTTGAAPEQIDITSFHDVERTVKLWQPDAVFYLAAVHGSSQQIRDIRDDCLFDLSLQVHVQNAVNFLEALSGGDNNASFFYAASSHVFGETDSEVQDELTPFRPSSVYAITKAAGVHACRYYRARGKVRASAGILYNHESSFRSEQFVSRRIVKAAVDISRGRSTELVLGRLASRTDWGYAPDFADAMIRIVELPDANDYVIATGEAHSVEEFVEIAFSSLGLDWRDHVREDPSLLTSASPTRIGNSDLLRSRTGWRPSLSFEQMVRKLVEEETQLDS
jgi:GDPmannose 4,6-dehydratase